MKPPCPTSTTITAARNRASKHGWDASFVRTELDARAVLDAGCYMDQAAGDRVVNYFQRLLRHSEAEWAGKPFILDTWQEHGIIRPLFGWKRGDGTRRHRRGGIWIPKKNGKSTLASGISSYLMTADSEPSADVYSAANDKLQAAIIFKHLRRMIEQSPELLQRIGRKNIIPSTKTIYDPVTGSTFRSLSADAPTKEGFNIHGLIVDEIHAMKSRVLWDTLVYGGASRRQPLILSISTAGVYNITTIGWEQYTYAKQILDGHNEEDWSFFALIYEASKDDDWTSEETWKKANPAFGQSVKADAFAEECREAKAEPRKQNTFRRYRLNQWVQQATRWIPLHTWDENNAHPVSRDELYGLTGYGGLDLASVSDITAFALGFECPHDAEAVDVLVRMWVPEAALSDKNNKNAVLYREWVAAGFLETTPGNVTDYDFIEAAILADAKVFNIKGIAIDRLFQGQQVQNHLIDEGLAVSPIGQGFLGQGPPMKEFERRWKAHRVHHGGHPILRWMADNVEVKQDPAGNLKIVKPNNHNDPRKVDGIQAIVNAFDPLTRDNDTPSDGDCVMVA